MKEIELKPGWLARQMDTVRKQVDNWPDELKALRHINDHLKHKDEGKAGVAERTKPLPCPFCGEAKRIGVHLRRSGRKSGYQVKCLNCSVAQAGVYYGGQEQAIEAWNQRAK